MADFEPSLDGAYCSNTDAAERLALFAGPVASERMIDRGRLPRPSLDGTRPVQASERGRIIVDWALL